MKRYISIDIGGTAIKYGIIGEDAEKIHADRGWERWTGYS